MSAKIGSREEVKRMNKSINKTANKPSKLKEWTKGGKVSEVKRWDVVGRCSILN